MKNSSTNVQPSFVSLPIGKPLLAVRACDVCGFPNVKPALKINDIDVGHCCLSLIGNLAKCNGKTLIQELENQTKYIYNEKYKRANTRNSC